MSQGWYLLDWGPLDSRQSNVDDRKWLDGTTRSQSTDFWDIEDLRKAVPVLKSDEFWETEKAENKDVPSPAEMKQYSNNPDISPWKRWLRENADENIWKGCQGTCKYLKDSEKRLINIPIKEAPGQPPGDHRLFDCMNADSQMCDAVRSIHPNTHLILCSHPPSQRSPLIYRNAILVSSGIMFTTPQK